MRLPSWSRVYYLIVSAIARSQKPKVQTYHKMHFDGVVMLSGDRCFEIRMLARKNI